MILTKNLDQDIYNHYSQLKIKNKPVTEKADRQVANFLPDEELIIVPYREEKGYVEKIHDKNKNQIVSMRTRVQDWIRTEEFANNHGLTNLPVYQTSTAQQRRTYFERNYLRFFTRDLEQSTNQGLQNWWESWTIDDEIDSIEQVSSREPFLLSEHNNNGKINKLASRKEIELSSSSKSKKKRKKFRIGTQPRLEQGAFLITMSSFIADGRVFLAANGRHEITLRRRFKSIRTRTLVNYYVYDKRLLASADKKLNDRWSVRLSHDRRNMSTSTESQDDRIQLNYRIGF
ncbi:hypothetical protein N9N67_05395 [Bacteriovoracaceae bacterium]|nr:hypothetical protein [Bacteriovoracaceae bacterium]